MKTRVTLASFIDELIYHVVLGNRFLSDAAELPDSEYKALRFIDKNDEPTMRTLATFLGVSLPRTTMVAETLVKKNLVLRSHGSDRRTVHLRLTSNGEKVIAVAAEMHLELSEAILKPLSTTEREQLYTLIKKCYEQLKQTEHS